MIEKEKEDKAVGAATGEMEGKEAIMKMPKKEQIALPGCTAEGIVYILECLTCRHQGRKRQYVGETSRSGYQRGKEHRREVEKEVATHPMTLHFQEEHSGNQQETVFRIISKHYTPLERQVIESVVIEEVAAEKEECLNLKSEWGGSKLPRIAASRPK